jgi:hypothetical protein
VHRSVDDLWHHRPAAGGHPLYMAASAALPETEALAAS